MSLATIIGILIAEAAAAVVSVACFGLIYREFHRRRSIHLIFFSLFLLGIGIAFGCLFLAHWAISDSYLPLAAGSHTLATYLLTLSPFFLFEGLSQAYGRRHITLRSLAIAILALAFLIALAVWPGSATVFSFSGTSVNFFGWQFPILTIVSWSSVFISLLTFFLVYRESSGVRRMSGLAALGIMAIFAVTALTSISQSLVLVVAMFFLTLIFLTLVAFTSAAIRHPDQEILECALSLIRRSLTFKAVIFNVAIFWALSFVIVSVVIFYFVRSDIQNKKISIQNSTIRLSECIYHDQSDILQAVQVFSLAPRVLPSEPDQAGRHPYGLDPLMAITDSLAVRILDPLGQVIYSNVSSDETGLDFGGLDPVRNALTGRPTSGVEIDPHFVSPFVLAASSVVLDNDTKGVILLSKDLSFCGGSSIQVGTSPTGYGLIDSSGEAVAVAGRSLSDSHLSKLVAGSGSGEEIVIDDQEGIVVAEPISNTAGQVVAYTYSYLSSNLLLASSVRLAVVIIVLVLAALALITAVLIYSLTGLIRPIRQMQKAALAVESGDYSYRLAYKSTDELGKLARAFNQMSQTIGEQTDRLRRKMREQMDFLINTANEMRTPLNVFSWTVDMMRFGDTGRLNKGQLELVEQLRQTTDRLSSLVQNLLDTAEMDRGGLNIESEEFQVADVLDAVAGGVSIKAMNKKIEFVWVRPESMMTVQGDAKRTRQILDNLVGNALKYAYKGGKVTVSAKPTKRRSPKGSRGSYVQVDVEDNGRGIPKDEHGRVFTKFFRARNAVSGDIEGAGLGLFITKRLVEMQGGEIWFKSTEDIGSVFSFTLPASKPTEDES